jgi:hypothetical protein
VSDLLRNLIPEPEPQELAGQSPTARRMRDNTSLLKSIIPYEEPYAPVSPEMDPSAAYRQDQKGKWYQELMELTAVQDIRDPKEKEQEIAKIQVSMYLADRMGVHPKNVYMSWDRENHSPIASEYFEQIDMPISYRKRVANEIERAAKTWQSLNMATEIMYQAFDPEKYKKIQDFLATMPPDERPQGRAIFKGGAIDWFKEVPIEAIRQAPYLLDTTAGGMVVGGVLSRGPRGQPSDSEQAASREDSWRPRAPRPPPSSWTP